MTSSKKEKSGKKSKKKARESISEPAKVLEDKEEDSNSIGTVTTSESTKSVAKRSVTTMHQIILKKALGKKIKVSCTHHGTPNGPTRATLQSYIGTLARTMVPIDIPNWPSVDSDLKERIWEDVEGTFKLPHQSKRMVLTSAGTKWRQLKTMLTRKYVLPNLGRKKKLRKPPKQYNYVGLEPWNAFVRERKKPEWLTLHNEQSARVKKRKYHHRLSRLGYIGLEERLRNKLPEGEELDRAILWKKARERKSGEIDEELVPVITKIDDLLEKKKNGELKVFGSDDVLTKALKTPEHSGRVRAVGGYVNPSTYFNIPTGKGERVSKATLLARDLVRDRELEETKKKFEEESAKQKEFFLQKLAALEALVKGNVLASPTAFIDATDMHEGEKTISPISDKASFHDINNGNAEAPHILGDDNVRDDEVEIITELKFNGTPCELAVGNTTNIVAFGTIVEDESANKTIHGTKFREDCIRVTVDGGIQYDAALPCPVKDELETVRQAIGSHVAWPKNLIICKGKKTGQSIKTKLDAKVFGYSRELFVLTENVTDLLEMKWIGAGVIAAYMAHLHEILEVKNLQETFGFIDPTMTFKHESPDVERFIVNRLKEGKSDRIFLMPHNPGSHWVLTIIWEHEIYLMDSMPKPVHYKTWENTVISAVKTFNAETGMSKKVPKWKQLPGAAKQPGGHECGYYVMRYMKKIIEDEELSFPRKWAQKNRKQYTQEELDEVRIEVSDYLGTIM